MSCVAKYRTLEQDKNSLLLEGSINSKEYTTEVL